MVSVAKLISSFIILFLFISCGITDPDVIEAEPKFKTSDPYFDTYKLEFSDDYYDYTGKTISINYPINLDEDYFNDKPGTVGVCSRSGSRPIEIILKTSYWEAVTEECRINLLYHEIGQCSLLQSHRDSYYSLMNSTVSNCDIMSNYESIILEEFFTQNKYAVDFLIELFDEET